MIGRRGQGGACAGARTVLLAAALAACTGCSGLGHVDGTLFPAPARDSITFWGHACCYIDVAGVGIVTDPVFDKDVFLRHRFLPVPPPSSYAQARIVLISHAHSDHLSRSTLATFPRGTVVLCPKESAQYLTDGGLEVRPMAPGDEYTCEGVRFIAVAAHHMGSRYGVRAAADGRALGWVVETPSATVFYSGDTNYFSGFANVGWSYHPDIAILNVNGHLLSRDAARAAWATGAGTVVPIHWGAFGHWVVGGNKHPREEEQLKRLIGDRLVELNAGQSIPITDPHRVRTPALP